MVPALTPMAATLAAVLMFGAILVVWVVLLVRHRQLAVGYGVILVGVTLVAMAIAGVPQALDSVNYLGSVVATGPGLVVLVIAFLVTMVVYVLSQLTALSDRITAVVRELAIRDAERIRSDEDEPTP